MDRRMGPPVARNGMTRALALSLVMLLAGCGGHASVQMSSNTVTPGGVSSGGAVQAQSNSTLGVLLAIGVLMGASYATDRAMPPAEPAPGLDPARRVLMHDCTQPIVDWSANLRCK